MRERAVSASKRIQSDRICSISAYKNEYNIIKVWNLVLHIQPYVFRRRKCLPQKKIKAGENFYKTNRHKKSPFWWFFMPISIVLCRNCLFREVVRKGILSQPTIREKIRFDFYRSQYISARFSQKLISVLKKFFRSAKYTLPNDFPYSGRPPPNFNQPAQAGWMTLARTTAAQGHGQSRFAAPNCWTERLWNPSA